MNDYRFILKHVVYNMNIIYKLEDTSYKPHTQLALGYT